MSEDELTRLNNIVVLLVGRLAEEISKQHVRNLTYDGGWRIDCCEEWAELAIVAKRPTESVETYLKNAHAAHVSVMIAKALQSCGI